MSDDVIDRLAGIAPGSPLDTVRARRSEARSQAQASYEALFAPVEPGGVAAAERFALAGFVAAVHGQPEIAAHYLDQLADKALADVVREAAADAAERGPYGHFPAGPLSREDAPGPSWHPSEAVAAVLGRRVAAGAVHAHMLVFHPRDSAPAPLQALLDAGWTTTDIVTLSQLVAFLSFQIRVVAGLRVFAAAM